MKAYLLTTATLFGLITIVHIWRIAVETGLVGREPWMIVITALSAALCGWGIALVRTTRRAP